MTKTPWTPRPWSMDVLTTSDPNGDEWETDVEVTAETGTFICGHDLGYTDEVDDIIKANARLIAAAPDLYEALVAICITAAQLGATDMEMDIALTALAKARGEE